MGERRNVGITLLDVFGAVGALIVATALFVDRRATIWEKALLGAAVIAATTTVAARVRHPRARTAFVGAAALAATASATHPIGGLGLLVPSVLFAFAGLGDMMRSRVVLRRAVQTIIIVLSILLIPLWFIDAAVALYTAPPMVVLTGWAWFDERRNEG